MFGTDLFRSPNIPVVPRGSAQFWSTSGSLKQTIYSLSQIARLRAGLISESGGAALATIQFMHSTSMCISIWSGNGANLEKARRLFGAALSHEIRLVVAEEFLAELRRTSSGQSSDPLLQMALRMPRLPKAEAASLKELTARIHEIVFVETASPAAGKKQSISDAGHLAHAALSRASAFITRGLALLTLVSDCLKR